MDLGPLWFLVTLVLFAAPITCAAQRVAYRGLYFGLMVAAGVTGYLLLQLLSPADLASTDAAVRRGAEFLDAYAPPIAASLFVLALGCLIGGCVYRPPMAAPVAPAPVRQAPAAATPRA